MPKYNGVIHPRGFSVTVEADDPNEAYNIIDSRVRECYTVTLVRGDDSYDPENLLDDFDIDDIIELDDNYTTDDYLLDEACKMLYKYLPEDFIHMIDDDLHNRIVCAFEDYISKKEGI